MGEGVQAKWVWRSKKCSSASAANESGLCSSMLSYLFCLLGAYSILFYTIYLYIHIYIYIYGTPPPPKDLGSHILIYNQVDGAHSLRLMGWV